MFGSKTVDKHYPASFSFLLALALFWTSFKNPSFKNPSRVLETRVLEIGVLETRVLETRVLETAGS